MSKSSRAQYEANRRNAKHSRGPTSASGKGRSSQHAMRHGLTGRVVVLPTEDMEAYKNFSKELVDSLNPETPMERQFAQTVADTQWRLNRARSIEDGMLAMGHFEAAGNFHADNPNVHSALTAAKVFREHSKDFVNLSLYEQRLSRTQKEAFRQLRELQTERKAARLQPIEEAKPLTQAAGAGVTPVPINTSRNDIDDGQALSPQRLGQRPEPLVSGFVCSSTEINPLATEKTGLNPHRHDAPPVETPLLATEKKAA